MSHTGAADRSRTGFIPEWGHRLSLSQGGNDLQQLYRQDFENYRRRFYPVEDELRNSYRNVGDVREAQQQALADVGSSFGSAEDAYQRRLGGLGLALSPTQEQDFSRRSGLAQGLAEVTAMNRTNRRFIDRDRELLTSGVAPRSALSRATEN